MRYFYGVALVILQCVGLVSAAWFLFAHRPTRWRRIEAIDAMGFPAIVALVFTRSIALTLLSWPVVPRSAGNAAFSLLTLALVDGLLIVKLVNFRRFVRHDRAEYQRLEHPDPPTPTSPPGLGD